MISFIKPLKVEVESVPCEFHQKNPDKLFSGCTCSKKYSAREKYFDEMTREERDAYLITLWEEKI